MLLFCIPEDSSRGSLAVAELITAASTANATRAAGLGLLAIPTTAQ